MRFYSMTGQLLGRSSGEPQEWKIQRETRGIASLEQQAILGLGWSRLSFKEVTPFMRRFVIPVRNLNFSYSFLLRYIISLVLRKLRFLFSVYLKTLVELKTPSKDELPCPIVNNFCFNHIFLEIIT